MIRNLGNRGYVLTVCFMLLTMTQFSCASDPKKENLRAWWPQGYSVLRDNATGTLSLSTKYYTVVHDLKKGGAITKIKYTYGKADNLLVKPIGTSIRVADNKSAFFIEGSGTAFSDLNNSAPKVSVAKEGESEIITVECSLQDKDGKDCDISVKTRYEYRWGYIKIYKEFSFPDTPTKINNMAVLETIFHPSLTKYGYRQGISEQEAAIPFNYGTCQWGTMRPGTHLDDWLKTRYVPMYLLLANQGVEGIEWFVSSDLSQWDFQMTDKPGVGLCFLRPIPEPQGISVSICPVDLQQGEISVKGTYIFDYYIGMSILEEHAIEPLFHKMFGREKASWSSEEEVKRWANRGVKIATFQDGGPYYGDGMYWEIGKYPPYKPEEMKNLDKVIERCHKYGIKVAPYFSAKLLHPLTEEYKKNSEQWGEKPNDHGQLIHFPYKDDDVGVRMCLKSGFLEFLKSHVDTVLKNHNFDGVYYDWCVPLYCNNPLHMGKTSNGIPAEKGIGMLAISPTGHWDIDELIDLIEWTRQRVGKDGVLILHDTQTPMLALENFANHMLVIEWGYGHLLQSFPPLEELPLEWNLVGHRPRGVIPTGVLDAKASKRLHRLMGLSALMTSILVEDWADRDGDTPEEMKVFEILKPLGDIKQYRFEDWRNTAVKLNQENCYSAVYSKSGEAYILLANFEPEARKIICNINPGNLENPLSSVKSAVLVEEDKLIKLDINKLTSSGESIIIPADSAVLLNILQDNCKSRH